MQYTCNGNLLSLEKNVGLGFTKHNVVIELSGFHCKGTLALDHFKTAENTFGPVIFYDGIDMGLYQPMLESALCEK